MNNLIFVLIINILNINSQTNLTSNTTIQNTTLSIDLNSTDNITNSTIPFKNNTHNNQSIIHINPLINNTPTTNNNTYFIINTTDDTITSLTISTPITTITFHLTTQPPLYQTPVNTKTYFQKFLDFEPISFLISVFSQTKYWASLISIISFLILVLVLWCCCCRK